MLCRNTVPNHRVLNNELQKLDKDAKRKLAEKVSTKTCFFVFCFMLGPDLNFTFCPDDRVFVFAQEVMA